MFRFFPSSIVHLPTFRFAILLVALLLSPTPALADDPASPRRTLSLQIGTAQVCDSSLLPLLWLDWESPLRWHGFAPLIRFGVAEHGATYAALGAAFPISLGPHFSLRPSWTAGHYDKGGQNGLELGFPVEFQTSLAFCWHPSSACRLDLTIAHVSNAHLSHRNRGTEIVALGFAFPIP